MALRMRGDAVGIQRPATGSGRSLVSRTLRSAALDPVLPQLVDELLDAVGVDDDHGGVDGVQQTVDQLWEHLVERCRAQRARPDDGGRGPCDPNTICAHGTAIGHITAPMSHFTQPRAKRPRGA